MVAFIIGFIFFALFHTFPRTITVLIIVGGWMAVNSVKESARQLNAVTITAQPDTRHCGYSEPMRVRFANNSDFVVKSIDTFYVRGVRPNFSKPDYDKRYDKWAAPVMTRMLAPGEQWETCVKMPETVVRTPAQVHEVRWEAGIGGGARDKNDGRFIEFISPEEAARYM